MWQFSALTSCHQPNLNNSNYYLGSEIKVLTRLVVFYKDCERGPANCFYFNFFAASGILWLTYGLSRLQEFRRNKSPGFQDSQRTRHHHLSQSEKFLSGSKWQRKEVNLAWPDWEAVSLSLSSRCQGSIGHCLSSDPCFEFWRSCHCCHHLRGVHESLGIMTPVSGCSLHPWVTGIILICEQGICPAKCDLGLWS